MRRKICSLILTGFFCFLVVFMMYVDSVNAMTNRSTILLKEESSDMYSITIPITQKSQITQQDVHSYGIKGFLVKQAIKIIKIATDKGGDVLNYILKWLDKDTAKYFENNKDKVVKSLDDLENWVDDASDLAQITIKNKLNSLLMVAGVPGTYSLPIADAIARTITWLVL